MNEKLSKNALGLTFGIFCGGAHLLWVILVAAGIAQTVVDWIMSLHFISMTYTIGAFAALNALLLVVITFVLGYVLGWLFAALLNVLKK